MEETVIIDFTDITLNESDGFFEEVQKIMRDDSFGNHSWVIRSDVTILSHAGMGSMTIQCHSDGSVYILDYNPSINDVFYNPDLQSLSVWAQERGWKIPQPHSSLVKIDKEFWKYFYDTLIIDSDYLDEIYGIRPQLNMEHQEEEDEEDDDEDYFDYSEV
jgi:hypothetical protein